MTRTPVQSSNVASIGYDEKRQELEVESIRKDESKRAKLLLHERNA